MTTTKGELRSRVSRLRKKQNMKKTNWVPRQLGLVISGLMILSVLFGLDLQLLRHGVVRAREVKNDL